MRPGSGGVAGRAGSSGRERPGEEPATAFDARALARAYPRMAPGLLAAWLLAGAPPGPGAREVFVAALLSVFVVAGAARSQGLGGGRSTVRLALHRAYAHSFNVLLLLLFLFLAAGLGGTVGGAITDLSGVGPTAGQVVGGALGMLPVLWWHWPVMTLACVVPDEAGSPIGRLWRGPGYTAARRLLRSFGRPARTAMIVGLALLWIGVLAAVEQYRGTGPLPAIVEAASYALFLPLLAWMATVEANRLVASVRDGPGGTVP